METRGFSAVHWAAYLDEIDNFQAIISRDFTCELNKKTKRGYTPLHLSILQSSTRVFNCLMQNIANHPEFDNSLILQQSYLEIQNEWGETALHLSSSIGNVLFTKLLIEKGANQQAKDAWGRIPLKIGIENGFKSKLECLFSINNVETVLESVSPPPSISIDDKLSFTAKNEQIIKELAEFMRDNKDL
jgi:ankyrin repeat protein